MTTTLTPNSGEGLVRYGGGDQDELTNCVPAFTFPIAMCDAASFITDEDLEVFVTCPTPGDEQKIRQTIQFLEGCNTPYGLALGDYGDSGITCLWALLWEGHEYIDPLRDSIKHSIHAALATEQVLANIPR